MKSYKEFLVEMSRSEAIIFLDLDLGYTEDELKKAYRKASSKNHPDRGGSTEAMQKVNQAYDILKNGVTKADLSARSKFNDIMNDNDKVILARTEQIYKFIEKTFKPKNFIKFFTDIFETKFAFSETIFPDKDFAMVHPQSFVTVGMVYESLDGNLRFKVDVAIKTTPNKKSLDYGDSNVETIVVHNTYIYGKNVDLFKTGTYTNKDILNKPEVLFDESKLLKYKIKPKSKAKKLTKSNMLSALKIELNAKEHGDYFMLPTRDGKFLAIIRRLKNRVAEWHLSSTIFVENGVTYKYVEFGEECVLPETTETIEILKSAIKLNAKDGSKFIKKESENVNK